MADGRSSEKKAVRRGAKGGSASVILIFIVLCLGTFGLLALSSARNDLDLAERNEAAVAEYYRADGEGEAFRMKVEDALQEARSAGEASGDLGMSGESGASDEADILSERLGDAYSPEDGTAWTEIPMENGQALSVVLGLPREREAGSTKVLQWKVVNVVDYEIDQDMPVWDGR